MYGKKSGRGVKIYATHETCAMLRKFKIRSWLANTGVRLASAEISGYVKLDGTLRCTGPDSKYDAKQDRRLQLFSDTVDIRYYMAQLDNPEFFDHPNQRFAETKLGELRAKLYGGAKFRKKHSAVASIYGLLVLLVIVGTVCASYLYASSLPLPDLEQYHVLVPVVLSFPFLLISSSLRAICRKALGMDSAYVSAKDVKTIQKMLSGLDAEIPQLRITMESQQANARRILLDQRDNDSANAEVDREGYP